MDPVGLVDPLAQRLVPLVISAESEADQPHPGRHRQLKPENQSELSISSIRANQRPRGRIPRVGLDLLRELLGELDLGPDVPPQPLRPIDPHHEPELEGAEPAAQGNVPVPVVRNLTLVLVLEVQRVNIEGIHNLSEERNIL